MVRYAPVLFVKVTLYSVGVYGKGTLSYGGLPMFLHRVPEFKYRESLNYDTLAVFIISALTEPIRHVVRFVQKLYLMFTQDSSVQIKFLSVQFLQNGFVICPCHKTLKFVFQISLHFAKISNSMLHVDRVIV